MKYFVITQLSPMQIFISKLIKENESNPKTITQLLIFIQIWFNLISAHFQH
jgi:hypothetical protein